MKKVFLLALPLLFLLAGCSDDDDKNDYLKGHPIIGKWIFKDYETNVSAGNYYLEENLKTYMTDKFYRETDLVKGTAFTFKENGKVLVELYDPETGSTGETAESSYRIDGDVVIFEGGDLPLYFIVIENRLELVVDDIEDCSKTAAYWDYSEDVNRAEFIWIFSAM